MYDSGFDERYNGADPDDRANAIDWAQQMLARPDVAILDTETTGLKEWDQVVEIAIINPAGDVLFNEQILPTCPISQGAAAIHGLSLAQMRLKGARSYLAYWPALLPIFQSHHTLVYNYEFDARLLTQTARAHGLPGKIPIHGACVMEQYAAFVGEWNSYHGNYKWPRLPGGDHSALGDCRATLAVLREMAQGGTNA